MSDGSLTAKKNVQAIIWSDGYCENNGSESARGSAGWIIRTTGPENSRRIFIAQGATYLPAPKYDQSESPEQRQEKKITNNVAEWLGLLNGLKMARELGLRSVELRADSQVVISQLTGEFKTKAKNLVGYRDAVRELISEFDAVSVVQVVREQNVEADAICNTAIDNKANVRFVYQNAENIHTLPAIPSIRLINERINTESPMPGPGLAISRGTTQREYDIALMHACVVQIIKIPESLLNENLAKSGVLNAACGIEGHEILQSNHVRDRLIKLVRRLEIANGIEPSQLMEHAHSR